MEIQNIINELATKHGEAERERIETGVKQAADLWREEDGTAEEFHSFCLEHFVSGEKELENFFNRFQDNLEQINGHFHEMSRFLKKPLQVDIGEKTDLDLLFSSYSPSAHLSDDLFKSKLAFAALLNFKIYTLGERTAEGGKWSWRQWAEARLASHFSERMPASAEQELEKTLVAVENYINEYNFYPGNAGPNGKQFFSEDLKLQCHWGLRDQLKGLYASKDGLIGQKTILKIMDCIVAQTIPQRAINNPKEIWDPDNCANDKPEPDTRYKHLLNVFHATQKVDEHCRQNKTLIDRRFNENREIPEKQAEALIREFLSAPIGAEVGKFVSGRLGRPLLPFDIWFNNFVPKQEAAELDNLVKDHYPDAKILELSMPRILMKLGFDKETAESVAKTIILEPGRSAGHATGAERREDVHYLRVRFPKINQYFAPDYQSFTTFMHEFGHGIEMHFSLHQMDYNLLNGVPNIAFTEALAFVFQAKSLEVLGAKKPDEMSRHLGNLGLFWATREIAGVSLVDMQIWRWMYQNPSASPKELKEAVMTIAKTVWNEYYEPVFGIPDQTILAVYSHIFAFMLYIPDYFLGSLIQHQIQEYLKDKNLAIEVRRMYTRGKIAPDLWMQEAVGSPISCRPLIESAEKSLKILRKY
ncbi:MAG: hypothetical protein V1661_00420 [bacterium]